MSDLYSKNKRSEIMRTIRSSGNKSTEIKLIEIFSDLGIKGWRRHYKVKGHPDFVFIKERIAIFVDGCFWHGHDCRNTKPNNNSDFWEKKQENNRKHDIDITERFQHRNWTVIRIWECELKKKKRDILLQKLTPLMTNDQKVSQWE